MVIILELTTVHDGKMIAGESGLSINYFNILRNTEYCLYTDEIKKKNQYTVKLNLGNLTIRLEWLQRFWLNYILN